MNDITDGATLIKKGKVKDIYSLEGNRLLFEFSDRVSAFDVILPSTIPKKGEILCKFAEFWFNTLRIPNHMLSVVDVNKMIVKKLNMIPIECIVRGYLYGGLYERVKKGEVAFDLDLTLARKLPEPMFDPTTKSEIKDLPIDKDEAISKGLTNPDEFEKLKEISISLYNQLNEVASKAGFIIADIKFEFGKDDDGNILLADSVGPDEFRLWSKEKYELGKNQESWDKQLVRDWLIDTGYKGDIDEASKNGEPIPAPPDIPSDLISRVTDRYMIAYEKMTGGRL